MSRLFEMPPGCQIGNTLFYGGCFGKNMNLFLTVTPQPPSCLRIRSHLCQGARLEIENLCSKTDEIVIHGIPITPQYSYLLFGLDREGMPYLLDNDAALYPDRDETISLVMKINDQDFRIDYIRTKAMCH